MLVPTGTLFEFCVFKEFVRTVAYEEGTADAGVGEGCEVVGVVAARRASREGRCV
jgi:hypothetical protein